MLRPGRFSSLEVALLWLIAAVLLVAGGAGLFLGAGNGNWKLVAAGGGAVGLAAIFAIAARRGRPL